MRSHERRRFSLRAALIAAAILIAGIPAAVLGFRLAYVGWSREISERAFSSQLVAERVASEYEQFLQLHLRITRILADSLGAHDLAHRPTIKKYIAQTVANYESIESIFLVDASGKSIYFDAPEKAQGGTGVGIDFSDRAWFKEISQARNAFVDKSVIIGRVMKKPILAARSAIVSPSGRFLGALAVALDLSYIQRVASRAKPGKSGKVVVATAQGIVIAHPEERFVTEQRNFSQAPIWRIVATQETGRVPFYKSRDGTDRAVGFATVPSVGWKVVVSKVLSEIHAGAFAQYEDAVLWTLLAFLAALGPVVYLKSVITRPIRSLTETTEQLSGGDLSARADSSSGPTELRQLAASFNQMAVSLAQREEEIIEVAAERRAAAACLQLAAIVKSSSDAIISKSLDGAIVSWNKAAEKMFGYRAEEAVGLSLTMITPPDRSSEVLALLKKAGRGEIIEDYETVRVRKDCSLVDVSLTIFPLLDASGKITGVSTIARDITERRQAEKLRADFTAMIVHDLRSPLNAVLGAASMMEEGALGPITGEQKRWLGKISDNARSMAALVNDFLDLSKIEAGRIDLARENVDLERLIARVFETYLVIAKNKDLSLKSCVSASLPSIKGDPRRLEQVFANLLSNAIKFTDKGGRIVVGATLSNGKGLKVWVTDTGIGIPDREVPHLFQKYRQLKPGSHMGNGTGLGLVICKTIVEAHGGKIWVESQEGQGTTFFFTLPLSSHAKGISPHGREE